LSSHANGRAPSRIVRICYGGRAWLEDHMKHWISTVPLAALLLAGCVQTGPASDRPATLQIIAFNDFHGHIGADDQTVVPPGSARDAPRMKAGGAVNFAAAVARLRAENPQSAVVTAGDLISASPLVSGHFLDEPTVRVMNDIGIDFSALGNHEFDRGQQELKRIQSGGCAKYTLREPCQVMPDFPGASFRLLAANVRMADGGTLFQPFGIKALKVGRRTVRIGFVGMPLRGTPGIVSPGGVAGLTFADEAQTANALIPALRKAGADILVVLIHEGGVMKADTDQADCANMQGDLKPILAKLDPAFDLVISGHTHNAYVCDYASVDPTRPFLVTSAGQYGTLLTRITLDYDARGRKLIGKRAENLVVAQSPDSAAQQPAIAALVARYEAATQGVRNRVIGTVAGSLPNKVDPSGQTVLGNFIADAQLAAMSAPEKGGARIAFMNGGGVRAPITPGADGAVTFGDIYAAQPFGNTVVVKALTGAAIKAALEAQFQDIDLPRFLSPSQGFTYAYDRSRPVGQRVFDMRLNGQPIAESASYNVAMNSFMAQGGDGFTMFGEAPLVADGPSDLDALAAYVADRPGRTPPALDRIRDVTVR
jgi:5'-nucleotidase